MNEEIGKILAKSVCPVCGSPKERDVHVPRFGQGKNVVKWRCTNEKCEKSKQWILPKTFKAW